MKPVDVLRDDQAHDAAPFQLGQCLVSGVGPDVMKDAMFAVKFKKGFGMMYQKAVGRHFFRAKFLMELSAVYTVCAAKIRHAGLRGHAGAAKKDRPMAAFEYGGKFFYVGHKRGSSYIFYIAATKENGCVLCSAFYGRVKAAAVFR